jgi:hypothetical protein
MKKVLIVMIVAAMAVAACGGKKAAPAQPTPGSDATMPATGSGDGSAAAPTGDTPPPAM